VNSAAQDVRLSPRAIIRARRQAGKLVAELELLGFATVVHASRDHQRHPCVEVRTGPAQQVHGREFVYAAPDDMCDEGGTWSFWHSSMQRLAPLDDVSTAVAETARRAACPGTGCQECAPAGRETARAC